MKLSCQADGLKNSCAPIQLLLKGCSSPKMQQSDEERLLKEQFERIRVGVQPNTRAVGALSPHGLLQHIDVL